MRIIHIATHAGVYRGGAVQACRMATAQAARGDRVVFIANAEEEASPEQRAQDAASWRKRLPKTVRLFTFNHHGSWGRRFLKLYFFFFRPDVVHLHRDLAVRSLRGFIGDKHKFAIVAQRGTTTPPPPKVQAMFASPKIDLVVPVADAVRDVLVAEGIPAEKIFRVYGSVDTRRFAPAPRNDELRAELGFAADDFVLGSLSSYRAAKGLEVLLEAAAAARARAPKLRLLFLGSDVADNIAPLAAQHGVADICHFAGHQDDVLPYLHAMDCTIMCANAREGLSGVLRESLACAVPVISTASDGNPEIVRDRKTGLLVPPDDVKAIAEAIVWAANNQPAMKQFAENGRRWVEENCSLEKHAENLERAYTEAIRRRREYLKKH